ncbi:Bro-N domain-containing protein [Campylobacter helveticus]|uniref:BRO-N domain-containing protein n=1 Tax=Campylobacter helveticus TaxID=28898 RepID=UPI0022EA7467|nr:Bro-N domain-containing protein [Campylobacter helveticus]
MKNLPTNQNALTTTYQNENFGNIRVIGNANNPLFCLSDICKALGLSVKNVARAIRKEFEGVVLNTTPLQTAGGVQKMIFVTEPQLYYVLMRSDKPNAKIFRRWVINKVLPQIRKQGFYSSNQYISEMFEIIAQKLPHSQTDFKVEIEIQDWNAKKKYGVSYEVGDAQNKIQGEKK